jgi:DinB superfamily
VPEDWSAAEVVAHLIMVEQHILGAACKVANKTAKHFSIWKRRHLPLWLVEARVIKRKSPIPIDPSLLCEKEKMLGMPQRRREETVAFLAETNTRDLSVYRWDHPFLGSLNLYEWFEMIAAHQARHAKQIRQIKRRLPKVV